MNAPTFDAHSPVCPVCRRANSAQTEKLLTGLLVCKQCQERLVITWSGHYVRDPFHLRQLDVERSLRRESHPFYRILRDLRLTRPNLFTALLAGSLLVGIVSIFSEKIASKPETPPQSTLLNSLQLPL